MRLDRIHLSFSFQLSIGPFGNALDAKSNCCNDDSEIQFNLKLFLDSDDPEKAIDAVRHVINELGMLSGSMTLYTDVIIKCPARLVPLQFLSLNKSTVLDLPISKIAQLNPCSIK